MGGDIIDQSPNINYAPQERAPSELLGLHRTLGHQWRSAVEGVAGISVRAQLPDLVIGYSGAQHGAVSNIEMSEYIHRTAKEIMSSELMALHLTSAPLCLIKVGNVSGYPVRTQHAHAVIANVFAQHSASPCLDLPKKTLNPRSHGDLQNY